MPETIAEPALHAPPPDKPAHRPFPEVARAIRAQVERILDEWRGRTLFSLPELGALSVKEFKDDIAHILAAMADALESNEPPDLRRLVHAAPLHGFQRFMQAYDLADLFAEERVLRRVIVDRVEEGLGRQCRRDEAAALHSMIDIMLQQGVLALVQQQKQEIRRTAEVQLKYLSFLSHDLSNNFFVIAANLEDIEQRLRARPETLDTADSVAASLSLIRRTRDGMRRLLEHERLRHARPDSPAAPVKLRELVEPLVAVAAPAQGPGPRFEVEIEPDAAACTSADLLTIILQNLVWNAVKYAGSGTSPGRIRICANRVSQGGQPAWEVSVSDDGPGIAPERLDNLFNAFERLGNPDAPRGEVEGYGLGLAIASQAARLLGTSIEVQTQPGKGSTFSVRVPMLRVRAT